MQPKPTPTPLLMTEQEAAKLLGLSPRTLQKWRITGNGPVFVRASARAIRYQRPDLERWVEDRRRASTSDPGHAD